MPATNKKGMSATIGGRALDVNQRQRARRESEIARQTCRPCRSCLPIMPNSDRNQEKAGPSRREPAYRILHLSLGKREGCPSNLIWHFVRNGRSSLRSPENMGG